MIEKDEHGLERIVLRGPEVRRGAGEREGNKVDRSKATEFFFLSQPSPLLKKKTEIFRHRLPPRGARHLLDLPSGR